MAPNGIRHKEDAVKPQIPKPKLSVPRPGGHKGILRGVCFQDQLVTFRIGGDLVRGLGGQGRRVSAENFFCRPSKM